MDGDITIREAARGDCAQIAACITGARGPNYYSARYYDAEYLFGGDHELFAAFDKSGEMAGVTGISRALFDDERAMLSLLNIRPAFTGKGIAKKLLRHTVELLCARGVRSVKGYVVTTHPAIQGVLEGLGLRPAGLLHGLRDGKNAEPAIEGKCTLALYVRNVSVPDAGTLYIHGEIADLARRVYDRLGARFSGGGDGRQNGACALRHSYDAHDSVLAVQILESGPDLAGRLDSLTRQYDSSPAFTATILLSLCSPTAIYGYEALRAAGYRFCGFDPLGPHENAVFFGGCAVKPELRTTERLASFCQEVDRYD